MAHNGRSRRSDGQSPVDGPAYSPRPRTLGELVDGVLDDLRPKPKSESSSPTSDLPRRRCGKCHYELLDIPRFWATPTLCKSCSIAQAQRQWHCEQLGRESCVPLLHRKFGQWNELCGSVEYVERIDMVKQHAELGTGIVALIGKRGTGKTQAACVAIQAVCRDGRPARYTTAVELLADLIDGYRDGGGPSLSQWLETWSRYHLLVIDEVAEAPPTDHTSRSLTALIDRRYRSELPTMLIANVSADGFDKLVGPSVADRCRETGGLIRFEGWPSWRA